MGVLRDALRSRHRVDPREFERRLAPLRDALLAAQADIRQAQPRAVALIVTGIPAAGRSEVVNQLLEWLDPKFIAVHAFGAPSSEERLRPPLWRYWRVLPARGRIAIYFTGWYGEYLSHAMHDARAGSLRRILARILKLEAMLAAEDVRLVKVHLHVDAKMQRKRLAQLRADKLTRWRVTDEDTWLARRYKAVTRAFERCLQASDHPAAPWHVIDGTDPCYRALRVAQILLDGLCNNAKLPSTRAVKGAAVARRAGHVKQAPRGTVQTEQKYKRELQLLQGRLARLVRRHRFRKRALVLVFEGIDAAGKGGAIHRVTQALDARQYQVVPVSAPSEEERRYPYLWRFWRALPKLGQIAIFDRSWYGRVLVERVRGFAPARDWQRAYTEIEEFERELSEHGVVVAKFWLEVSKAEQLRRFKVREQNPLKRFKVDPEDWINRRFYDSYQAAAADMLARTDAPHAKWTVIAGDDKHQARLAVLRTICETLEAAGG